ncbi:MAG: hemerythrin domain-containing protein [Burkholderiales bacterium]|nr:hemerythrin domain-containing protein [Burkholderiales bacterium]
MPALEWSDDFVLNIPQMDRTHEEFVDLLAAVETASDGAVLAAWQDLVAHTEDHFSREDRWMTETRFAASNCHSTQHKVVLQIMQQGAAQCQAGDVAMVRQMVKELAVWFPQHAASMDAALANHLQRVGYDTNNGSIARPQALPVSEIHGCAGDSCSDTPSASQTLETTA